MNDPVTPARQVVQFARGVLGVELEHWQAEALEGLITSYGTACVAFARADDATSSAESMKPSSGGGWTPPQDKPLTSEPGSLPWPHDGVTIEGNTIEDAPEQGTHTLRADRG